MYTTAQNYAADYDNIDRFLLVAERQSIFHTSFRRVHMREHTCADAAGLECVCFFWVPMKHVNLDRFGAEELDEPTAELLKALHFSCTLSVWRVLK